MPTPPKQAAPDIVSQIGDAMDKQFRAQYDEALKREVAHTMDLEWLQSGKWVDEIYFNTVNLVARQATISGGIAARQLGVKVVDFIDRPHVQNAIKSETYKFAKSVNQATADKLKATLLEGNKAGDDIRAMTKRVQAVFLGVDPERATSYRAEMIARTESAQAYTVGTRQMWQETGVVQGVEWKASSDACIFCKEINGMQRKLDEAFFPLGGSLQASYQGKLYTMEFTYREILGPALHVNCRCALLAIPITLKGGDE